MAVDADALTAWFEEHVPGARPPLEFEQIAGGRSNLTFRVTDAAGRRWALRRPPLHSVLPSAHDVGREHRIISALAPTEVPVPTAVGFCPDDSVTGAPFYVMDFVDGLVLRDEASVAEAFDEEERDRLARQLVEALVTIHAVDPDAVGLGDLGRREGYIARQLRRWQGQWQQSRTRELPLVDDLHARLSERVPEQGPAAIVHGDYRLDNLIVSDRGEVRAVLDWELCTLGDPLADLGLLIVYWAKPYGDSPTSLPGFPPGDEVSRLYGELSGRDLSELDFYVAFGAWKLAVIIQGVYAREKAGAYGGGSADLDELHAAVERLAEAADRALED
jgi:aminoglycoside phosphotransferase (APT) family kinase protein